MITRRASRPRQPAIAILTRTNDLHALAVRQRVLNDFDAACDIIETDAFSGTDGLSWSNTSSGNATLPTSQGGRVVISDLDVIWYRRPVSPQFAAGDLLNPAHVEVVNQSCVSTLHGVLANEFSGTWVSDPDASRRSENKLVQLAAAAAAGFRVPETLISQDPRKIRQFYRSLNGNMVMKTVSPTKSQNLLTLSVIEEYLANDAAMRLCPTIFQEYIAGTRHLRILSCGQSAYAIAIDSPELDWRPNLDVPCEPVTLDDGIAERLAHVLKLLNLRMGVFDLKWHDNEPVFLEVNPQGQFLFAEGLTGLDLTGPFANFLCHSAASNLRT